MGFSVVIKTVSATFQNSDFKYQNSDFRPAESGQCLPRDLMGFSVIVFQCFSVSVFQCFSVSVLAPRTRWPAPGIGGYMAKWLHG